MVTCYTPEARDATGAALGAVEACLAGGNVDACIVELVQAHAVDAVACAVRARGAEAATTVQEQPDAGLGEREIADAAREWIRSHNVGYL